MNPVDYEEWLSEERISLLAHIDHKVKRYNKSIDKTVPSRTFSATGDYKNYMEGVQRHMVDALTKELAEDLMKANAFTWSEGHSNEFETTIRCNLDFGYLKDPDEFREEMKNAVKYLTSQPEDFEQ